MNPVVRWFSSHIKFLRDLLALLGTIWIVAYVTIPSMRSYASYFFAIKAEYFAMDYKLCVLTKQQYKAHSEQSGSAGNGLPSDCQFRIPDNTDDKDLMYFAKLRASNLYTVLASRGRMIVAHGVRISEIEAQEKAKNLFKSREGDIFIVLGRGENEFLPGREINEEPSFKNKVITIAKKMNVFLPKKL